MSTPSLRALSLATSAPITLYGRVVFALSEDGSDASRVTEVDDTPPTITVQWDIGERLSQWFIREGAQSDVAAILAAIHEQDIDFEDVLLIGTYPIIDKFGHQKNDTVLRLGYSRTTFDQINWADPLFVEYSLQRNVYDIADKAYVHPQLLDE